MKSAIIFSPVPTPLCVVATAARKLLSPLPLSQKTFIEYCQSSLLSTAIFSPRGEAAAAFWM